MNRERRAAFQAVQMATRLAQFRRVFFLLLLLAMFHLWASPAPAQEPGQAPERAQEQLVVAEPDLTVFTVMAAINAAGYDTGADRMDPASIRAQVRQDLATRNIPAVAGLREFYQAHRLADPARDVSQFVSLALMLGPPPKFEFTLSPVNLPPDVLELQEMVPLISAFYEQANVPALWNKYRPLMEPEAERYQRLLINVIQATDAYLRLENPNYMGVRFAVYLNPLAEPGLTDARNYGDNYYIVSSASATLPEEQIRHAWLHYLLDAYALKYPNIINSKKGLARFAENAPALDPAFRSNFELLLTESLIRAIETRLSGKDERAQMQAVQDSLEEGFLLTPYFFEAMKEFVKQPVGMRLYFPDMVDAIQVDQEKKRLAGVHFRTTPAHPVQEARWSPLEQMLREAQQHLAKAEWEEARQIYEALSHQYGPQAQVLYGLALVASQQKQPELAEQYFGQAAAIASDPRMKAWAHIYLGRLLDLEGKRDEAKLEYSAALTADQFSPDTKAAAEQGLQKQFSRPADAAPPEPEAPPARPRVPMGKDDPGGGGGQGKQ
jgi:tetratricopeptide (TPR) repeat protein